MGKPEVFRRDKWGRVRKVGYLRDRPFGVIGENREYLGPLLADDEVKPGEREDYEPAK